MQMDSADLSDESSQGNFSGVTKRNRLSFVCQTCRKNKTKCDKEKPRCGRCVKYHLKCVYDVDKQKPPRVPSKDALIKRLEGEVEYWKRKAEEVHESNTMSPETAPEESVSPIMKKAKISDEGAETHTLTTELKSDVGLACARNSLLVPDANDVTLNFYKEFPQLTMKDSMKRDIKPISDFAHVYRDKLLSLFVASIFSSASKNALIHSLPSEDPSPFQKSEAQFKQNAFLLRDNMLQQCDTENAKEKVVEFTKRIMGEKGVQEGRSTLFVSLLKSKLENRHVEDSCLRGSSSPELNDLKDTLEKHLPSLEIINAYKDHFYQYIYPMVPFLEIELFEEGLHEILSPSDGTDGKNITINFGTRQIRSKVSLIAILINVLRISYICMIFTFNSSKVPVFDDSTLHMLNNFPINAEMLSLSQQCISSVNLLSWTSENGIIALLYFWAVFVFTPDEGDFYLGQPTDALISLVSNLAANIGLHRDPADYKVLNDSTICDPRMMSLRKKLWLCIFITCRHETTLKARYHQHSNLSILSHSLSADKPSKYWCYDFDNEDPDDLYKKNQKSMIIKRHQLFQLLSETDAVTMELESHMTLTDLEIWLRKVANMLEEDFSLDGLINGTKNSNSILIPGKYMKNQAVNFSFLDNSICFQSHLIARMSLLRISTCLMVHFENRLDDTAHDYSPYFVEYFIKSFKFLLELIKLYQSYLAGDYDSSISPYMRFVTDKTCEACLSSILLTFLAMVIRITHAESSLSQRMQQGSLYSNSDYKTDDQRRLEEKLEIITAIKQGLEAALQHMLFLITKRLRFCFFSTFKLSIFFDYVMQIVKKGDILNVLKRVVDLSFSAKVSKGVYMGTGVDINNKDDLLQSLHKGNKILITDTERFKDIKSMMEALQLHKDNEDRNDLSANTAANSLSQLEKLPNDVGMADLNSAKNTDPIGLVNGEIQQPPSELLDSDAYNVNSFFSGGSFDFFDYDFLLGPAE